MNYTIKNMDELSRLYTYSIKVLKIHNKPVGFSIQPNEKRANILTKTWSITK